MSSVSCTFLDPLSCSRLSQLSARGRWRDPPQERETAVPSNRRRSIVALLRPGRLVSIRAPERNRNDAKTTRASSLSGSRGAGQPVKAKHQQELHADRESDLSLRGHSLIRHGEPGRSLAQSTQLPSAIDARPGRTDSRPRDYLKRAIRRHQLRQMVPLADTTIYEMEQRGEFPRRFYLTPRCVAWDAAEIEGWLEERRRASGKRVPSPDVRKRASRPVRR
ncbi:MAG: AlpA family phage regulatory protein [Rhodospirillales bacterium]|nr:AlpA family phage regulatory protein [Rhodospirillales bacterium]